MALTIFTCHKSFAQHRIGHTKQNIIEECKKMGWEYRFSEDKENKIKFKMLTISVNSGYFRYKVRHCFNNADICYVSVISPNDNETLNKLVRLYNEEYIPVSDTKWKAYTPSGIMLCSLSLYKEKNSTLFLWKLKDNE